VRKHITFYTEVFFFLLHVVKSLQRTGVSFQSPASDVKWV